MSTIKRFDQGVNRAVLELDTGLVVHLHADGVSFLEGDGKSHVLGWTDADQLARTIMAAEGVYARTERERDNDPRGSRA